MNWKPFVSVELAGTDRLRLICLQIWEHTLVEQGEKIPLGCSLGLEIPEDETLSLLLVNIQLSGDEARGVVLGVRRPRVDRIDASALSTAGRSTVEVAFPARSFLEAVQIGSAVGHGRAPFAHQDPVLAVSRVSTGIFADSLDVLLRWVSKGYSSDSGSAHLRVHVYQIFCKALIFMMINDYRCPAG